MMMANIAEFTTTKKLIDFVETVPFSKLAKKQRGREVMTKKGKI